MKATEKNKHKLHVNHYDPADLERIVETQHKFFKLMIASNRKKLVSMLIVIDTCADDPTFTRHSKLHSPYTKEKDNRT